MDVAGWLRELGLERYEEAFRDRVTLTDEAMAVERLGEPVAVVKGSETNRKLTTPDDLAWAEIDDLHHLERARERVYPELLGRDPLPPGRA